ncbi:hypothetical protein BH09BAC1_BH09BAC1_22100 [soil metagenome]
MHELEPFYNWKDLYEAAEDERSPFYGTHPNFDQYNNSVYNYVLHPEWDYFGSGTLYLKVLFADYDEHFAIIEFIGEWNDCIENDIMFLKRDVIDKMLKQGIYNYILIGENVLNFHTSDDCYYEEWYEDIKDEGGWVAAVNFRSHVIDEMRKGRLHYYINFNELLNDIAWRKLKPKALYTLMDNLLLKALT